MKITVNAENKIRDIDNFWNHIHFHPTDAIEDNWGRHILDKISKDNAARYVRIYAMLEDVVTRDRNGRLVYDYTLTDKRISYMIEKGFNLLICFNFMPQCVAEDPWSMSVLERYKGKRINFSKPKDYNEWQEICYNFTNHIVERYGIETVEKWYFHCWNEPDHSYWLNDVSAEEDDEEKLVEYCKLYDFFAEGIKKANNKLKIGGPSAAFNYNFIDKFLSHVKEEINFANGGKGSKFDFLSIHTYSNHPKNLNIGQSPSIDTNMRKTKMCNELLEKNGLSGTEIIVDEWGATCAGFSSTDNYPELIYRNNEYYPAFFAKMIDKYIGNIYQNKINLSKMMICLSGQHDLERDFQGYRNFFTLNHFPKPIYNGYRLASKLGEQLLGLSFDFDDENIGAIATCDKQGNYQIMIYYMNEDYRKKLESKRITLSIKGIEGKYELKHYRIDHNTSNSYTRWCELGKPDNPNQLQREEVLAAGELAQLYPEVKLELNGGYTEKIILNKNALSLIELTKQK